MDLNPKSKFRKALLSEKETQELIDVVKEAGEAIAEAATIEVAEAEVAPPAKVVAPLKDGRKFYGIERNNLSTKFEVIEVIETPTGLKRNRVVNDSSSLEVALARLNEVVVRLTKIKREF